MTGVVTPQGEARALDGAKYAHTSIHGREIDRFWGSVDGIDT
jgi:hypothetical protein